MLEALVLFACIKGVGCQDTVNAYYEYNKDLQKSVNTAEKIIKNASGDKFNRYIYPLALTYYLNRDLTVPLSSHLYIQTNKTLDNAQIRWNYDF